MYCLNPFLNLGVCILESVSGNWNRSVKILLYIFKNNPVGGGGGMPLVILMEIVHFYASLYNIICSKNCSKYSQTYMIYSCWDEVSYY